MEELKLEAETEELREDEGPLAPEDDVLLELEAEAEEWFGEEGSLSTGGDITLELEAEGEKMFDDEESLALGDNGLLGNVKLFKDPDDDLIRGMVARFRNEGTYVI